MADLTQECCLGHLPRTLSCATQSYLGTQSCCVAHKEQAAMPGTRLTVVAKLVATHITVSPGCSVDFPKDGA